MPTPRKLARKSSRQRTLTNPSVTNRRRRLLEALEQRVLLASDFTFNADPSAADVRLYTDSGRLILEDSDGTELKSEALADVENIELDGSGLSDKFRIGDLSGFFGTLTVDGDNGRDKVIFDGLVTMADINQSGSIDVTAEEIVIEGSANITAGDIKLFSTGNEGALSIANNLPLDITDVIEGERKISIKSGAILDGDKIQIDAQRIASLVSPVRPWGVGFKNAAVDIQGATITGDEISITTTTADENLTDALPDWANNWLAGPITKFIFDGIFPPIPVAAMIRSGESNITINDSMLSADGDISVNAISTTDASTAAMGVRDAADDIKTKNAGGKFYQALNKFAVGFSRAESIATTEITGTSVFDAGGNVDILSNATTTAAVTSTVRLNMNAAVGPNSSPTNPNEFGAAVAVTNSETTSTTTVGSEVQITATGNVNVHSIGDVTNSAKAGINIYVDGRGGIGFALGVDNATVETRVDGKIDAGGTNTDKELVIADIDGQSDTITLNDHGLKTGDELIYLAIDPNDDGDPPTELDAIADQNAASQLGVVEVELLSGDVPEASVASEPIVQTQASEVTPAPTVEQPTVVNQQEVELVAANASTPEGQLLFNSIDLPLQVALLDAESAGDTAEIAVPITPTHSAADCTQLNVCQPTVSWFGSVDYLYWKPRRQGLDMGIVDPNTDSNIEGQVRSLEMKSDSGLRTEVGLRLESGLESVFRYTYFEANDADSVAAPGGGQIWFTRANPASLNNEAANYDATADLNLNIYDLEMAYWFRKNCDCQIRGFGGFRYATIDQSHQATYTGGTVVNDRIHSSLTSLDAYGLRLGVESRLQLFECYQVFGRAASSVLIGNFETRYTESENGFSGNGNVAITDEFFEVIPGIDLAVGVSRSLGHFNVEVGYELAAMMNADRRYNFTGAETINLGTMTNTVHDLGLDGLFINFSYSR